MVQNPNLYYIVAYLHCSAVALSAVQFRERSEVVCVVLRRCEVRIEV